MHSTHMGMTYSQSICCEVQQPLEKVNQMDSTARSKEKACEKIKLEPYGMSLKKVLVMPNEGGVPVEEVKRQQGVQIKREYMIPVLHRRVKWLRGPTLNIDLFDKMVIGKLCFLSVV
eukprot:Gb_07947 [translate_table: standard]